MEKNTVLVEGSRNFFGGYAIDFRKSDTPIQMDEFYHLITNPKADSTPLVELNQDFLVRTRQYLRFVLEGIRGKPYCPYVEAIERGNGYYVRDFPENPDEIHFSDVVSALEQMFRKISPQETKKGQSLDITSVIAAFSHPEANTLTFCRILDAIRDEYRQCFLDQGLMLAQMHPYHKLGGSSLRRAEPGDEPLYTSGIPILVVRRMHEVDHVFMHNTKAKAAYQKHFPT